MIRRLLSDRRGAAAVEFAMVAPVLIATLMSVIEAGRVIWTRQVIQQTAFASARCSGLKGTGCENESNVKTYAIRRAAQSGVKLTANQIGASTAAVNCAGQGQMRRVRITLPYTGLAAPVLREWSGNMVASACFPIIAT